MFAFSRHPRRLIAALLTGIAWVAATVVVSATAAVAKVGPEDPGVATPSQTITVSTVDWNQLALTAAAACAIGVAATLAVQMVVRHSRHASAAHA